MEFPLLKEELQFFKLKELLDLCIANKISDDDIDSKQDAIRHLSKCIDQQGDSNDPHVRETVCQKNKSS